MLKKNFFKNKKVLITGHTGFKGSWLAFILYCFGARVYGYSLKAKTKNDNFYLLKLNKKIKNYYYDVRDKNKLKKTLDKIQPHIIFHLAGINRHPNEELVYKNNIKINNLLHSALDDISFKGKLIFTSSTQERLKTFYGKAKKEARIKFKKQSKRLNYKFYGIIAPNIFEEK